MALDLIQSALTLPSRMGRQAKLAEVPGALGLAVIGLPVAVACNGMALAAEGQEVHGAGGAIDPAALTLVEDPVLAALGLRLIAVEAPGLDPKAVALPALMLRVGLLGRILDLAHDHLKGRVSMGKKTLTHQLVKVGFADGFAAMRLASDLAMLRSETGDLSGLMQDHAGLGQATLAAEKLMGGHGYLIGGTHPVGYVSMLVQSIYGPQP